jgi:hypothetical protein
VQLVVDDDGDARLVARADVVADVGLERRVAPLVLGHLIVADPDDGAVRSRVHAQDDALAIPPPGHADQALVPHVADVVVRLGEHRVEAGRHRQLGVAR